jgi:hypothetical protein
LSGVRQTLFRAGATVALAALVGGCASPSTARDAGPPKLHIGTGMPVEARGAAAPADLAFGGYVLAGSLPTQPTHARVWRWPADHNANSADVAKLAAALGVTGTPERHAHGWVVASQTGELRVRDGGGAQWSFARSDLLSCPPMMIDVDHGPGSATAGCATAAAGSVTTVKPGATPPPPPVPSPGPDDAATRAAAQTLLAALGVTGEPRIEPGGSGVSMLSVAPSLHSLTTQGIDVTMGVDSRGIRSATGYLLVPTAGDDYPLRSAQSAFDDLAKLPRPEIAMYCGPVPPAAGAEPLACPTPKPIQVTGATLGLQLRWDGTGNLLVPAWFFSTEGSTWPIAIVAVDASFIDSPVPQGTIDESPATGGGSAGVPLGIAPAPARNGEPPAISPSAVSPATTPIG